MKLSTHVFPAFLIMSVLAAPGLAETATTPVSPDAAAVVNGEAIPRAQFDAEWSAFVAQRKKAMKPQQMTPQWEQSAKKALLNQMIEQRLIAQDAKKTVGALPKKDIDAALGKVKSRFKTPEAFQQELAKQKVTQQQFEARIEDQLRIAAWTNAVLKGRVKQPSEEEIHKLFDSVKAQMDQPGKAGAPADRQAAAVRSLASYFKLMTAERVKLQVILFRADEKSAPQNAAAAAKKAADVKAQLDKGANFADMAKQYSDDKATGPKGGEAGYFARGQLLKELEDAVFPLDVGQVSGVIKTKLGYQIVRVEEKTAAADFVYDKAKGTLAKHLARAAAQEELSRVVGELAKKAAIEIGADFKAGEPSAKPGK